MTKNKKIRKIYLYIITLVVMAFKFVYASDIDGSKDMVEEKLLKDIYLGGRKFIIYDDKNFEGDELYVLKSETSAQNESIIIKTISGELVVFDGGRKEDAEFLLNTINELGSKVNSWYLTHSHDDHIGAIIEILDKYKEDVFIENIYYNFPEVEWAYKYIGKDAGIITLAENKIKEYKKYIDKKNLEFKVNIYDKLSKDDTYTIDDVKITVINDLYKIADDPINNTSIVYKIETNKKSIMVLGDISYEGGQRILEENKELKSDFVVMAHHGQAGAGKELYEAINPDYCIWCTTSKIFNNAEDKYETDNTKDWMIKMGVKKHYITNKNSIIIR